MRERVYLDGLNDDRLRGRHGSTPGSPTANGRTTFAKVTEQQPVARCHSNRRKMLKGAHPVLVVVTEPVCLQRHRIREREAWQDAALNSPARTTPGTRAVFHSDYFAWAIVRRVPVARMCT